MWRVGQSVKNLRNLPFCYRKPDFHNINADTEFSENQLTFTHVITRKRTCGRTTDGRMYDSRTDTILRHCRVAGYKNSLFTMTCNYDIPSSDSKHLQKNYFYILPGLIKRVIQTRASTIPFIESYLSACHPGLPYPHPIHHHNHYHTHTEHYGFRLEFVYFCLFSLAGRQVRRHQIFDIITLNTLTNTQSDFQSE